MRFSSVDALFEAPPATQFAEHRRNDPASDKGQKSAMSSGSFLASVKDNA
jgi:hypothetical protein